MSFRSFIGLVIVALTVAAIAALFFPLATRAAECEALDTVVIELRS